VVDLHNGVLLSHKKEKTTDICHNMKELENTMLSQRSQSQARDRWLRPVILTTQETDQEDCGSKPVLGK
jgi:hypothetical protein